MKAKVVSLDNKKVADIDLSDDVFAAEVRKDILARMVNYQLAKRRAGTHKVKTRAEVSGGGRKPFRQKGGGRARQGSSRAPQHRGGAVIFGPVVRDHGHVLTKKVRRLAMKCALSVKQRDGKLLILDEAKVDGGKTRELAKKLTGLGLTNALIVGGVELDEQFARAARNIAGVDVLPSQGANVYDILRRDTLVLTREAVANLEARLT